VTNRFGRSSRKHLSTVDGRGQQLAHKVLKIKDHSIIQGHRNKPKQNQAFREGFSQLQWPKGKHNQLPSLAWDVQAYPAPDNDADLREEQIYLLGLYKGVGYGDGIIIRTGADFDSDGQVSDSTWYDLFHVEIDDS